MKIFGSLVGLSDDKTILAMLPCDARKLAKGARR
jgi:hypothetical protein